MKRARSLVLLLAVLIFRALPGAPQDSTPGTTTMTDPKWSALMTSMQQMDVAMMSVAPSGNSDADFVKLMLLHHQAAIDMAKAQLLYGKDPQMQRLAQEIITDQQSEIDLMQLWLKQHGSNSSKIDQAPTVHAGMEQ